MISRYEVPEISRIWSDQEKWRLFLTVELALLEALEESHEIPKGTRNAFSHIKINPERIQEIEKTTRHDVVAFCRSVAEQVTPEASRFFHYGVTSSDIIDTALALQVRDSLVWVRDCLEALEGTLEELVEATASTLCLGRSHGMAAEPMILGQKFLSYQQEFRRRRLDVESALENEITGQFSGAVGNHTILTPEIETLALAKLGLNVEPVSTQVIPRDRISKIVSIGALIASGIERLAVELRHLGRSEVGEVFEGFAEGQTGSSTMPHKRNPVSSENLCGIARVIRSHLNPSFENQILWHERDISHSSAERMILPDHFGLLVYAIRRLEGTLKGLQFDRARIAKNLEDQPAVFSSIILHALLQQNTCTREELYAVVQGCSLGAKNLESLITGIQNACSERKLNAQLPNFSLEAVREFYGERFALVRARAKGAQV